ncbi:hypothetical protein KC909_03975 [Candidatus Dojkabacteria bacterium]|uniref:Uncharacterized protein n=1 Tax=Candidatus Dojkabacteria bacterium TaxID=2099670 RepID=A0A955L6E4_9BACT|nr:hypothetical protein [Candidatus Dojkabacteria bacterium]
MLPDAREIGVFPREFNIADLDAPVAESYGSVGTRVEHARLENDTEVIVFHDYRARLEGAAYLVSEDMGFNLIPPTSPAFEETRQLFIPSRLGENYDYGSPEMRQQILKVDIFDYITARKDQQGYRRTPLSQNHRVIGGMIVPHDFEMSFTEPNRRAFHRDFSLGAELPRDVINNLNHFRNSPDLQTQLRNDMLQLQFNDLEIDQLFERAFAVASILGNQSIATLTVKDIARGRLRNKFTLGMMRQLDQLAIEQDQQRIAYYKNLYG